MKKLLIVLAFGAAFAVNYTGFNGFINISAIEEISFTDASTLTMDATTGVGTLNFIVKSNADNWSLQANSDYYGPYSSDKSHTLTSSVGMIKEADGGDPTYTSLVPSTDSDANQTIYSTGVFNYNVSENYTFYLKIDALEDAYVTYYTTYINLKFVSSL